jgi:Ycf66 protein N-terminus
MLNYVLGWAVSLGSLGFYLAGYLLPEVRRKKDAIWSGVGLIYALALLTNGDRISFGLLVGQLASATLIGWFGWQTIQYRRDLSDAISQTSIPHSVQGVFPFLKQGWERLRSTYASSEDDGGDLLASGVKKASALLAGKSEPVESFSSAANRSNPEAAPIQSEDDDNWADEPSSNTTAHDVSVTPVPETSALIAESVEHSTAEPVEDIPATVIESAEAIAPPEPAPVTNVESAESVEHSDAASTEEAQTTIVDAAIPHPQLIPAEDPVTPSNEDPAQPSSSATGGDDDWPPRDSTI